MVPGLSIPLPEQWRRGWESKLWPLLTTVWLQGIRVRSRKEARASSRQDYNPPYNGLEVAAPWFWSPTIQKGQHLISKEVITRIWTSRCSRRCILVIAERNTIRREITAAACVTEMLRSSRYKIPGGGQHTSNLINFRLVSQIETRCFVFLHTTGTPKWGPCLPFAASTTL